MSHWDGGYDDLGQSLVAACPHSAGHVEASDPGIIMRRSTAWERTTIPAMTSKGT